MPTNLPWRVAKNSGAIYNRDGVLVCEASPDDAAAIVEAMAVWRAVQQMPVRGAWSVGATNTLVTGSADDSGAPVRYVYAESLAAALIALAGEVRGE